MLPKNFRTLKRSISEKILGSKQQKQEQLPQPPSRAISTVVPPTPPSDDPYREILSRYDDNVSHLVLHGSSLQSMTSR